MKLLKIVKSAKLDKKYDAYFKEEGTTKIISFGAAGMEDFTITRDKAQQARYIARHEKHEDWSSPMTAGALSRFVLWSAPTLAQGIANYRARFGL